jgi:hypothetical protein
MTLASREGDPVRTIRYGDVRRRQMKNRQDHGTNHPATAMPSEVELLAMMDEADRDVASGRTVPMEEVLAELDEIVKEMGASGHARQA